MQVSDTCRDADAVPCFVDSPAATVRAVALEHVFTQRALARALLNLSEQLPHRSAQRCIMLPVLFNAACRLRPCPRGQIDVGPFHRQRFTASTTGQQQDTNDVRRLPIGLLGQGIHQPGQLVTGQIAPAIVFGVFLDALARIVVAHAPANSSANTFDSKTTSLLAR